MEGFHRKNLLRKEELFSDSGIFFWQGERGKGFSMQSASSFYVEWRVWKTGYLTGADQEIPDCLIKITALAKVETALRSGIKPEFG